VPEAAPDLVAEAHHALTDMRRLFTAGDFSAAASLCERHFRSRPELRDEEGHPIYLKEGLRLAIAMDDTLRARELAARLRAVLSPDDPLVANMLARRDADHGEAPVEGSGPASATPSPNPKPAPPTQPTTVSLPRTADGFEGAELALTEDFAAFVASTRDAGAPDMRFVHAHESTAAAPARGLVRGDTWFGPATPPFLDYFRQATTKMIGAESVSLADADYVPQYATVFSARRGAYLPSVIDFAFSKHGATQLVEVDRAYALDERGILTLPRYPQLAYEDAIAIPVNGCGFYNYGHFLFDGLGIATFMAERLRREGARLVGGKLEPWQMDILVALGVDDLYLQLRDPTRFRRIVTSSQLGFHVAYVSRFGRMVFDRIRLATPSPPGPRGRHLFVRRADSSKRRILSNRSEVVERFQHAGFEIVQPETLSFAEQVRLFASASVIAGESGAAMANVGFCDPGTRVLEILPDSLPDLMCRGICLTFAHEWSVYFAEIDHPAKAGATGADRLGFTYRVDLAELDKAIERIRKPDDLAQVAKAAASSVAVPQTATAATASLRPDVLAHAKMARREQRFDEADALLRESVQSAGQAGEALAVEYALVANDRRDWVEALARWGRVVTTWPHQKVGLINTAHCLLQLGRLDDLDRLLEQIRRDLPSEPQVLELSARAATARQNWAEAVHWWSVLRDTKPDYPDLLSSYGSAVWNLQFHGVDGGGEDHVPRAPAQIGSVVDAAARELLLQFESLGENCEFGLLQRRFGAEPLGLLRWTATHPPNLCRLLASGFAELGEGAELNITLTPWNEYIVKDGRSGVVFHTFISSMSADAKTVLEKQAKRLRWLRDKLVGDLRERSKVFVYKAHFPGSETWADKVREALVPYGRPQLFWVQLATAEHPAGTVRMGEDGVLYGYLDRVNPRQPGDIWEIPDQLWLQLCRDAGRLARLG
jgi:tetratricopeptide (TPR) repeat protein